VPGFSDGVLAGFSTQIPDNYWEKSNWLPLACREAINHLGDIDSNTD